MSVKLKLLVGDTKRQKVQGMVEAVRLGLLSSVALVGPLTSGVATEVSKWLSSDIPGIDRTIISYTASSAQLSEPSFPNFLRTRPTSDTRTKMVVQLIKGLSVC